MSDGASVPRLFWWWLPPWGDVATRAALVHDWLLTLRDRYHPETAALLSDLGINLNAVTDRTRAEIDRLFYEALLDLGILSWRAWPTYAGVRAYAIATETILPPARASHRLLAETSDADLSQLAGLPAGQMALAAFQPRGTGLPGHRHAGNP